MLMQPLNIEDRFCTLSVVKLDAQVRLVSDWQFKNRLAMLVTPDAAIISSVKAVYKSS